MKTRDEWVDHYAQPANFGQVFKDYAELKATNRTHEQNVQFKALSEVIDGKLCL